MTDDLFVEIPLFKGFTPDQLEVLRPLFIPCEYHAGTVLFEQGDLASHFYVVATGEVAIQYKPEDDQAIIITHVKPGGIVGWSAVIGRSKYTSSAYCTSFANLHRVSGAELQELSEVHPETCNKFMDRLAEAVAERLQGSNPHVLELLENSLRNGAHEEVHQKW
jgi:CRP-like cAMP-binding protein